MTKRPVIAVITNLDFEAGYMFPGYPRATLNEDYPRSIADAGGVPLLLCPTTDMDVLRAQLGLADGLLLAGGADLDPTMYGQDPTVGGATDPSPIRDACEAEALRIASERDLPVLGICRGLQLINACLGGTLHQDLPRTPGALQHISSATGSVPWHGVRIEQGSLVASIVGASELRVNSYHHQAIDTLAAGLVVTARAADGVIEAIEAPGRPAPLLAVQWHPEMMSREDAASRRLFSWFVDACR